MTNWAESNNLDLKSTNRTIWIKKRWKKMSFHLQQFPFKFYNIMDKLCVIRINGAQHTQNSTRPISFRVLFSSGFVFFFFGATHVQWTHFFFLHRIELLLWIVMTRFVCVCTFSNRINDDVCTHTRRLNVD